MATLYLDSIRCGETETVIGMDQCSLKVFVDDGEEQQFRRDMKIGELWDLQLSFEFVNSVRLELWELDQGPPPAPNPNDKLGSHEIRSNDKGKGEVKFSYRGARYEVRYRVE